MRKSESHRRFWYGDSTQSAARLPASPNEPRRRRPTRTACRTRRAGRAPAPRSVRRLWVSAGVEIATASAPAAASASSESNVATSGCSLATSAAPLRRRGDDAQEVARVRVASSGEWKTRSAEAVAGESDAQRFGHARGVSQPTTRGSVRRAAASWRTTPREPHRGRPGGRAAGRHPRAGPADRRPAPPPLGPRRVAATCSTSCWPTWHAATTSSRPSSCSARRCTGRRPRAAAPGRRDRVRQRRRRHERQRRLRADASAPASSATPTSGSARRCATCWRPISRGGRRPLPGHPRISVAGTSALRHLAGRAVPPDCLLDPTFRAGFAQLGAARPLLRRLALPPADRRAHRPGRRVPRHADRPEPRRRPARHRAATPVAARRGLRELGSAACASWRRCPNVSSSSAAWACRSTASASTSEPAPPSSESSRRPGGPTSRPASRRSGPTAACSRATSRSTRELQLRASLERLQASREPLLGRREDGAVRRHRARVYRLDKT